LTQAFNLSLRRWSAAAVALLVIVFIVATGRMAGIDQWSIDHLMPYRDRPVTEPSSLETLVSPLAAVSREANGVATRVLFALTLPAAPLVAAVAGAVGAFVVFLRGRPRRAAGWAGVFVGASVAEVLMKTAVERPLLHQFDGIRDAVVPRDSFNHSFPSGHTLRGLLLALLLVELVPRLRTGLAVWLGAMSVALVVSSMHTPSDVAGGVLLAVAFLPLFGLLAGRPASGSAVCSSEAHGADSGS
jgi:membrane-associated phospholipid phosphatase